MATNDTTYQCPTYTKFAEKVNETGYLYWEDWIQKWESLRNCAEMVDWLHILFDTIPRSSDAYSQATRDKLLFCLDIAKNHLHCRFIAETQSNWEPSTPREVIKKATSMLIANWFNIGSGKVDDTEEWFANKGLFFVDEEILSGILEMFIEGKNYGYRIPYFLKDHEKVIVRRFLTFIAALPWSGNPGGRRILGENHRKLLRKFSPEFIKMLVDLDEIDMLINHRHVVSLEDVKTLRRIVFKPDYRGRIPSCTGEILGLDGREKAAETLLVLESALGFVHKRREKIRRLTNKCNALKSEFNAARDRHHELSSAIAFCKKNGNSPNDIKRMEGDLAKLTEKGDRLAREVKDFEFKLRELAR